MNQKTWKVIEMNSEPYCEMFDRCPKFRRKRWKKKGGKPCDGHCPKNGTENARIGIHSARRKSKQELRKIEL